MLQITTGRQTVSDHVRPPDLIGIPPGFLSGCLYALFSFTFPLLLLFKCWSCPTIAMSATKAESQKIFEKLKLKPANKVRRDPSIYRNLLD